MALQTATTGNLTTAMRIALAKCRFTEEHNAPCANLVDHYTMKKGEKLLTIPKVGQNTAVDLVDGVDMMDSEDIGLTSVDLTADEVGVRTWITKKLLRQFNEDVFKIVGRQMGDAMTRKKERDVIALYSALNGGIPLGSDGTNMTMQNISACIARAQADKVPTPVYIVHHPNAIFQYIASLTNPAQTYPMPKGFAADLLEDWYYNTTIAPARVPIFQTGNIDKIGIFDSAYGCIASRDAMAIIEQMGYTTEKDLDISMRAYEIVVTSDYGVFEVDDSHGYPIRFEMGNPSTTN